MFGLIVVVLVVLAIVAYLGTISRSRRTTEHLYDVPDDLERADDNHQPPFDGTSGLV